MGAPPSVAPVFHTVLEGAAMGAVLTMGSASKNMPDPPPAFVTAKRSVFTPTRKPEEML